MNVEDLRNELSELQKKKDDCLTKRKSIIKEIKNFSF